MSQKKHLLEFSRHERTGATVVAAFIAVTLLVLWLTTTYIPSTPTIDQQAVERFESHSDSLAKSEAQRDSMRNAKRHNRQRHATEKGQSKRGGERHSQPKRKTAPAQPRRLDPVPHIDP